jgi:hypothetical protein
MLFETGFWKPVIENLETWHPIVQSLDQRCFTFQLPFYPALYRYIRSNALKEKAGCRRLFGFPATWSRSKAN